MARARRIARMGAGVLLFIGLGQAQEDGPPAADLTEQTTSSEVLPADGESTPARSLEERWAAALDAGIGALTPELTDAILTEAQSKGLWELELDVRYWIGHRAFFFEGPDEAHLHWRFLTDLEPDDVHRSHISRAENSVGLIYMLRGDWVTARDHYRLALQLAAPGQRNQPRINLANAEIELGEWRSAVRLYARALEEATPREAFACLAGLSNVCLDVGLLDAVRALDGAAQALLDDPEIDPVADVGPWSQYALDERACRMLLKAGAFRAAQQGLEDLRREVPFEDLSWTSRQSFAEMLAELALETGRPEHALATLDENRLLNPEHSATPSEWMLRASALARLSEWERAWEALENCDPDQLSSQSQGFEDFWTLFGELAMQTGRQAEEALARRRIKQAEQYGVQLTRSDLLATFTLPGLRPFVGHLAVEAAPEELRGADSSAGGESPQAADSPPSVQQSAPDAAEPLTSVDRRLWLLNGAGLAALLMVAMSWWFQWRRHRELDRLQAALDVLEESRLPGTGPRERRSASHRALEATLELLNLGSDERVVTPEWGGDEGDVDRMLELAGDCLRLHRLSVGRAGVVRVRSDVGRALLTSARQLEGRALEQGLALKFALPKEPVVWSIPDRELARLLERLLTLAIEAARPQSSLRFELHRGAARSWLNVDLDEPGPLAETLARGLSGAEASSEGAQVVLQDIRVLVLQRVARARDAKFAVQADAGVWRLALTWPTPARVPNS